MIRALYEIGNPRKRKDQMIKKLKEMMRDCGPEKSLNQILDEIEESRKTEYAILKRTWALWQKGRPESGYVCPALALSNCRELAKREHAIGKLKA